VRFSIAKDIAGHTYRRCHACGIARASRKQSQWLEGRLYLVPEAAQFHAAAAAPKTREKLSARVAAD
jgi:hypothetical protein